MYQQNLSRNVAQTLSENQERYHKICHENIEQYHKMCHENIERNHKICHQNIIVIPKFVIKT